MMNLQNLKSWRWYHNSYMVHLWVNLLVSANNEDGWCGMIEVKRGQLMTSLSKLSADTGLSVRKIRTCLSNLEKSGEITENTTNHYRIITITNYSSYQEERNCQGVNCKERQTSDKQKDIVRDYDTTGYRNSTCEESSELTNKRQSNDKEVTNISSYSSEIYTKDRSDSDKQMTRELEEDEKEKKQKKENSPYTPYKEKKQKKEKVPSEVREEKKTDDEKLIDKIKSDRRWLQAIAEYYDISADRILQMINRYCIHRICSMSSSGSTRDIKRHFDNWLRIQLREERLENERKRRYERRTGISADVCKTANYRSTF